MTGSTQYLGDGWGALDRALIFCPNKASLPIAPEILLQACEARWPGRVKVYPPKSALPELSVEVAPPDDYFFHIDLHSGGQLLSTDGNPEQNIALAAWLRSLMPEDASRIVVSNGGFDLHADLPYGVTPEQIASTMVDHCVDGWEQDDPDFRQW